MFLHMVEQWLPEGTPFFTDGEYTDQSERFLASEIVREKVFLVDPGRDSVRGRGDDR